MPRSRVVRAHIQSNVVGYIALFCFAIGGTAIAAQTAPKNSVKSKSIKDGQVKTADLAADAVTADQVAANAIGGGDVADNSLKGSDIDESSLALPAAGGPPTGPAGGDLSGAYPNPQVNEGGLNVGGDLTGSVANAELGAAAVGPGELATLPAALARATAPQTIPNATVTPVALNLEVFDTAGIYDAPDDAIEVPIAGTYLVVGHFFWNIDVDGIRRLAISVNGSDVERDESGAGSQFERQEATALVRLQPGDDVSLNVRHTANNDLFSVAIGNNSDHANLAVQWLGP